MKCPSCGSKTKVVLTRQEEGVQRVRKCTSCTTEFKTYEVIKVGSIKVRRAAPEIKKEEMPGFVGYATHFRKRNPKKVKVIQKGIVMTEEGLKSMDDLKREARHKVEDINMKKDVKDYE